MSFITTRGFSMYRFQQEMQKRMRRRAAAKGVKTRALNKKILEEMHVGYKACAGACGKHVRTDAADSLCGPCWSQAMAARRRARRP